MAMAIVALAVAIVASVIVIRRPSTAARDTLVERTIAQGDLDRLVGSEALAPSRGGVSIKDAALARALGLAPGDAIVAVSGRPVTRGFEVVEAVKRARELGATAIYVERADGPVVRWKLPVSAR